MKPADIDCCTAAELPQSGGIRAFALTHSRRIVFNDAPWLISFSLSRGA
jgi:hypothetical protein